MIRVKICGIQEPEHALAAAEAGADYIGLVFVPGRRRRVEIEAGRELVSQIMDYPGHSPQVVGLFANQPLDEVNQIVETCGLDLVQLCGGESLDYAQQIDAGVIKVVHVPGVGAVDLRKLLSVMEAFLNEGHLVTLDRQVEGTPGGTGQTFDWGIAARLSQQGHDFLLAGGLTPDNVAEAIGRVHPWGVDVSSGVETNGIKDPDKIRAFVNNVRQTGG